MILALETTGVVCGAALHDGTRVVAETHVRQARVHDALLGDQIADVMRVAKITAGDLEAVACSIGPGSFTGIRIGLAMGKGLCFARTIPLVAVPTFDALARAARPRAAAAGAAGMLILQAAGGTKVYWARYDADGRPLGPCQSGPATAVHPTPGDLVLGDGQSYFGLFGSAPAPEAEIVPLPAHVADLGAELFRNGQGLPPTRVEPLYVTPVAHRPADSGNR